jgi:transposase
MNYINYVGIDMAKNSFVACFSEQDHAKKFNNTTKGIQSFFRYLKHVSYTRATTLLGVESTGSYHLPLCMSSRNERYSINVINPLIVKKQNLTTLRRVKNDNKDAQLIRYCLVQGNGYPFQETNELFTLKALVRQRNALSHNKNRIRLQRDDFQYKGNIINTSINTIYSDLYEILEKSQKTIEQELTHYNKTVQQLLRSIPGVGPVTAASFVSEVVDINRFKRSKHLVAYTGIDPRTHESGETIKGKGYITKRGNKILRTILYNAASVAVRHENTFQTYFQKKLSQGKPYRVALVATMRKMICVIHAVWTSNTPYEERAV